MPLDMPVGGLSVDDDRAVLGDIFIGEVDYHGCRFKPRLESGDRDVGNSSLFFKREDRRRDSRNAAPRDDYVIGALYGKFFENSYVSVISHRLLSGVNLALVIILYIPNPRYYIIFFRFMSISCYFAFLLCSDSL